MFSVGAIFFRAFPGTTHRRASLIGCFWRKKSLSLDSLLSSPVGHFLICNSSSIPPVSSLPLAHDGSSSSDGTPSAALSSPEVREHRTTHLVQHNAHFRFWSNKLGEIELLGIQRIDQESPVLTPCTEKFRRRFDGSTDL